MGSTTGPGDDYLNAPASGLAGKLTGASRRAMRGGDVDLVRNPKAFQRLGSLVHDFQI